MCLWYRQQLLQVGRAACGGKLCAARRLMRGAPDYGAMARVVCAPGPATSSARSSSAEA